jgi:hypothetical protein
MLNKIIYDYIIPTLDEHFPCSNEIFQKDNTSPHRSKVIMAAHENAKMYKVLT